MTKIGKQELVDSIKAIATAEGEKITKTAIDQFIDWHDQAIKHELAAGNTVQKVGLLTLTPNEVPAHTKQLSFYADPAKRRVINVEAKTVVKATVSPAVLKEA